MFFGFGIFFVLDKLDCFVQCDFQRVYCLGSEALDSVVMYIRPKASGSYGYRLASYSPKVRGSLNRSKASSNVIVSMDISFLSWAKRGFSLSLAVPICTTGPKRPIFTDTCLPLPGSWPKMRSPALWAFLVASVFSTDGWKPGRNYSK